MEIIVDNRLFVIGLCELYRQKMKEYEAAVLLPLAASACEKLNIQAADCEIEGYYSENDELIRFFKLIRSLQNTESLDVLPAVELEEIRLLRKALNSPAMGRRIESSKILPRTSSPFGQAMSDLSEWSIDGLSHMAKQMVTDTDSGLIAVASATGDPVAIGVARESQALMADLEMAEVDIPTYNWDVSSDVRLIAEKFISSLAETTGILLPVPDAVSAEIYGQAAAEAEISGRCTLLGEQSGNPFPYYHWYIDSLDNRLVVKDFWSSHVWTTDALRSTPVTKRPILGSCVGAPYQTVEKNDQEKNMVSKQKPKGWLSRIFRRI